MAGPGRDALREMAANRGLKLVASRVRTPGKGDYGRYGLTDSAGAKLLGFAPSGLTATAEEIEAYLHKGLAADWKSSLRPTGGKAKPGGRKRAAPEPEAKAKPAPEPEPEPEPEPPPLAVRTARPADAAAIAGLVEALGYPATAEAVAARLTALRKELPLVAERGGVIGILTWHVTPVLHRPRPVGRITMMTVARDERRRGVGRALVDAAGEASAGQGLRAGGGDQQCRFVGRPRLLPQARLRADQLPVRQGARLAPAVVPGESAVLRRRGVAGLEVEMAEQEQKRDAVAGVGQLIDPRHADRKGDQQDQPEMPFAHACGLDSERGAGLAMGDPPDRLHQQQPGEADQHGGEDAVGHAFAGEAEGEAGEIESDVAVQAFERDPPLATGPGDAPPSPPRARRSC